MCPDAVYNASSLPYLPTTDILAPCGSPAEEYSEPSKTLMDGCSSAVCYHKGQLLLVSTSFLLQHCVRLKDLCYYLNGAIVRRFRLAGTKKVVVDAERVLSNEVKGKQPIDPLVVQLLSGQS